MSDQSDPLDELVDLVVFAPLGLLFEAKKLLPELAKRGKKEVANARAIGKFVVPIAKRQVQAKLSDLRPAVPRPAPPKSAVTLDTVDPGEQRAVPKTPQRPVSTTTSEPKLASMSRPVAKARSKTAASAQSVAFPIADYDSLPSAAVVELLDRLTAPELQIVLSHEQQNRKRRTIITRATQRLHQ